jgi:hypothetical protein
MGFRPTSYCVALAIRVLDRNEKEKHHGMESRSLIHPGKSK